MSGWPANSRSIISAARRCDGRCKSTQVVRKPLLQSGSFINFSNVRETALARPAHPSAGEAWENDAAPSGPTSSLRLGLSGGDLRRKEPEQSAVAPGPAEFDQGQAGFRKFQRRARQLRDHFAKIGLVPDDHQTFFRIFF